MKLLLNQARRHYSLYSPSRCLQIRCFSSDQNPTTAEIENPRSYGGPPLQQSPRLSPSENMRSLMDFTGISGYVMARPTAPNPRLPLGSSEDEKMVLPTVPKSRVPFGSSGKVFMEALEGRHYQHVSGSEKPSALSTRNWYHSIIRSHPPSTPPRFGNNFAAQFASFSTAVGNTEVTANTMNTLRPLSPHLPIYKPQLSSTVSIFNRISGASLAAAFFAFHLLCLKMGPICFTYFPFYKIFFYTSQLAPSFAGIASLALSYHTFMGIRHFLAESSGFRFLRIGGK
ncbi:succinate dehydrogenase subunit 3 [Tripterygium wilfordii]|uniref:Succinate dehydrogenase subunit 3 n=1 Tax=Tripterygium wilfordii TaxID=458696 RepID=A0A7J7CAK9_TRIWF|nr:uncharacterized protein LOC119986096 [Tripterygium wilfordii]KAF5730776.1 succinate dehydrogenase subunit 3 [Tripterygium wilfordii]